MTDAFYGEIRAFAFDYAPANWARCNGASVPIQQYTYLYAVIGNEYGGTKDTFNLPNLQARAVVGAGQGTGLSYWQLGGVGGQAESIVKEQNIPAHDHGLQVVSQVAAGANYTQAPEPQSYLAGVTRRLPPIRKLPSYVSDQDTAMMTLDPATLSPSGGTPQSTTNVQPYLAINYCICTTDAEFPIRP